MTEPGRLAVALVHYPCVDRAGEVYATSLTNLDAHDIARSTRTYDVAAFYIVHPVEAQRALASAIATFWDGNARNPDRGEALSRLVVVESIEEAIARERAAVGDALTILATSARPKGPVLATQDAATALGQGTPMLLLFGTGHGLADAALDMAEATLAPIAPGAYNHLSVRSAVAITLDRLRGQP